MDPSPASGLDQDAAKAATLASELSEPELANLRKALVELRERGMGGQHIEIGTAAGGTLVEMLDLFDPVSCPPFWVVDTMSYFPGQMEAVQRNVRNHGHDPAQIRFMVSSSAKAFTVACSDPPRAVFLLIDANHEVHGVMGDLRWARFVQPGGIVCLHDYWPGDRWNGVTLAADRFLRRNPHYERLLLVGSLLLLRKQCIAERAEVGLLDLLWAYSWRQPVRWRRSLQKRWRKMKQRLSSVKERIRS